MLVVMVSDRNRDRKERESMEQIVIAMAVERESTEQIAIAADLSLSPALFVSAINLKPFHAVAIDLLL